MLRISEVTKKLGVSRSTVYNYIKELDKELTGHMDKVKGVQYIDNEGFELLRKLYKSKQSGNPKDSTSQLNNILLEEHDLLIAELRDRIKSLESDKERQDEYIHQHVKEKENLTELLRNSQVLMKQEQDRVLMLEHKLEDQHEDAQEDQEENQDNQETIWSRIANIFNKESSKK